MKQLLIATALLFGLSAHSANAADLDALLKKIEADISAKRLTKPAGNNALESIDAFRKEAPFDFRITPLLFKFGESYVALANKAIASKKYKQAQGYLDIAWQVAPLAQGLEAAQDKLDQRTGGKFVAAAKPTRTKGPSKEELAKRKAAAAAEKKRLDAERRKKAEADKKAKKKAAQKAAANKKARQAAERKKQADAEAKRKKQAAAAKEKARKASAKKAADAKARKAASAKAAKEKSRKQELERQLAAAQAEKERLEEEARKQEEAKRRAAASANATTFVAAAEKSAPIASYPLPQDKIESRDRGIADNLVPICQAIIDNDASIVLHAANKGDYRWLTVRLTLCTRRLDTGFRLRHSFQTESGGEPYVTLHPARSSALIKKG